MQNHLIREYLDLRKDDRDFIKRVALHGSGKYEAEPYSDEERSFWKEPEKAGFIESVGALKFEVTDKYRALLELVEGEIILNKNRKLSIMEKLKTLAKQQSEYLRQLQYTENNLEELRGIE